jgi:hypothetical protein
MFLSLEVLLTMLDNSLVWMLVDPDDLFVWGTLEN